MNNPRKVGHCWAHYFGEWVQVADSEHDMRCDRSADLTKEDLKLLLENWPDESS